MSTQAAGALNSSLTSVGVSADEVVAIALSNVGDQWAADGCAAFVWGVTNLAGLPYFDLENKTFNNDPKSPEDIDYRVPHSAGIKSGTANTPGDGWYLVSRSSSVADLISVLQPGDVVRVYKAGNSNEDSIDANGKAIAHSFIVVSNSAGDIEVVDNWKPGAISKHSLSDITNSWALDGQFAAAFVSRIDSQWVAGNIPNNIAGNAFGDWSTINNDGIALPTVIANSLTVAPGQSVPLSSIFSVSGARITEYKIWFSWPDGGAPARGTLTNNGTAIPLNQPVTLTSLDGLVYTGSAKAGTDKIWLEAYNGSWSNNGEWTEADITDRGNTECLISRTQSFSPISPTITRLSDGFLAVAWNDTSGTIKSEILAPNGDQSVPAFLVGTGTEVAAAALGSGRFVLVWHQAGADGSGNGVLGQIFNSDGSALGSPFRSTQRPPAISKIRLSASLPMGALLSPSATTASQATILTAGPCGRRFSTRTAAGAGRNSSSTVSPKETSEIPISRRWLAAALS